jgi:phospholipid/cholesterol/gamma-HCH transport system substrate-binding protein
LSAAGQGSTAIKLVVFVVLTGLLGLTVFGTLRGRPVGTTDSYHAIFGDVSGLHSGDPVRVSGVVVGRVSGEQLVDATHVRVTFTANRDQRLTTTTSAVVRYANLLGQRFLALVPGDQPGAVLRPGGTIPQSRTAPALSLTALFNGFRPLFQSLNPNQINELAAEIVQILQGEGGTIEDLLAQTAQLTTNLADRDQLFTQILDSLSTLLATVSAHDGQLSSAIGSLKTLTGTLSGDSPEIGASISAIDKLMNSVGGLLAGLRQHNLHADAIDLNALAAVLAKNSATLDSTIKGFPKAFTAFDVATQSGSWLNAYPCAVSVAVSGTPTATPAQIASLIAAYLGGGSSVLSSVLNLVGGLFPKGLALPVPLKIPAGAVGNPNTHSAVCR